MQYNWSILSLKKEITDGCVLSVTIGCKIADEDKLDFEQTTEVLVDLPAKNENNFIEYNNLTSELVLDWALQNISPEQKTRAEVDLEAMYIASTSRQLTEEVVTNPFE
jgi:hypothetical protein